ncbi:MAG: hypothetical protein WD489_07935 [Rhodovibrionaceae bacterium]
MTLQDCIALCDLTEAEVDAVAEHEHVPEMLAAEMANYIIHSPDGVPKMRRIIEDDIQAAVARGDLAHAAQLLAVLRHFIETHPDERGAAARG